MTLDTPVFLLFLAIIPLIVLLHLVRRKRWKTVISSTLLWEEVRRELRRRFAIDRLLTNLLLLLQVAAIVAIIVSLASPVIPGRPGAGSEHLVIVVDTSAGMGAVTNGESRLERAKREARRLIADVSPESPILLAVIHRRAELLAPGPVSAREAEALIESIAPTAITGDFRRSIAGVIELASPFEVDRIIVFTDLAFDPVVSPVQLEIVPVGGPAENIGITSFTFRKPPSRRHDYELLLRIESHLSSRRKLPISIDIDGVRYYETEMVIDPESGETIIMDYDGPTPGEAIARIGVFDSLEIDNTAYAVFNPRKATQVLQIGPTNIFLENAFAAHPNLDLTTTDDSGTRDPDPFDLVVLDRVSLPRPLAGARFYIGIAPPEAGLATLRAGTEAGERGFVENPRVTGWNREHPLLEGVDPQAFTVYRSNAVPRASMTPGFSSVVHAEAWSLLWTIEDGDHRAVGLSFDLASSSLPLTVDFPILVANIVSWLDRRESESAFGIRGGAPIEGSIPGATTVIVHRPDGTMETVPSPGGAFMFHDTTLAGIYRIASGDFELDYAVNVASPSETDLSPRGEVRLSESPETETNQSGHVTTGSQTDTSDLPASSRRDAWPLLAAFAIALIALEWRVWTRRMHR